MIGLSGEIPLVSHSDVTSPFPPSGNGGYASNLDVCEMAKSSLNTISILVYASKAVKNVAGKVQYCYLCSTCLD